MSTFIDGWPNELQISSKRKDQHFCLVEVKGQVMDWDGQLELWRRQNGGGMSCISLNHCTIADEEKPSYEYYTIEGRRISDQVLLMDCMLTSDLKYTLVNSAFHHWTANNKKFGVTFSGSGDANLFHAKICQIIEKLSSVVQSLPNSSQFFEYTEDTQTFHKNSQTSLVLTDDENKSTSSKVTQITRVKATPPPPRRSETAISKITKKRAKTPPTIPLVNISPFQTDSTKPSLNTDQTGFLSQLNRQSLNICSNSTEYSAEAYVSFSKNPDQSCSITKHDYNYPTLIQDINNIEKYSTPPPIRERLPNLKRPYDSCSRHNCRSTFTNDVMPNPRRNTTVSLIDSNSTKSTGKYYKSKTFSTTSLIPATYPPQPLVNLSHLEAHYLRVQCIYCQEFFTSSEMLNSICKDAPDKSLNCIKNVTCFCCAEAATYHCVGQSDDEGGSNETHSRRRCKRRIVFAIVCLFVPCIWCYPILKSCHKCAVGTNLIGPKHRASSQHD